MSARHGPERSAPLPALPADPGVAVVIPARDAATDLASAVACVLAQDPMPEEIVIAVGPSADATRAAADALAAGEPRIRVVDNPSGGTADGLNRAVAATSAPVVARVDAHAGIPPDYLATAVSVLRVTGAANVGGLQVPEAQGGFARAVAAAMRSPLGTGGAAYRSARRPGPVDTVYLGVFRRAALEAVGGFDPAFVRNQDAELNQRLVAAGYTVWLDPALRVTYRPRASVPALASQYLQYGRWRRLTVRRHPGSLRPRQMAPALAVFGLLGAAGASLVARRGAPFALVGGGYAAVVLAGAVRAAPELPAVPQTALALATMHISWGVGFLLGPPRSRPTPP